MHLLDSEKNFRRIDREDAIRAFELLSDQAREAWQGAENFELGDLKNIRRIVVSGMGGSALGPQIIRSVYRDRFRVPVEIMNGYTLPGGVGPETLVVLSSYSGTTEETLATAAEARRRQAKLLGICAGGPLAALLKKYQAPVYVFSAKNNPGNRPRLALGYSVFGLLGLFASAGLLSGIKDDVESAIAALGRAVRLYGPKNGFAKNPAKRLAVALDKMMPVYVGAEHLEGNAHALANQTNETGKQFAAWFPIPELNHHLMEGLAHPAGKKNLAFVFLKSKAYSPRVQKRFALTDEVVRKNNVKTFAFESAAKNKLAAALDALAFGGALTYYLGILHRENPSPNPWVDYFKKRLA